MFCWHDMFCFGCAVINVRWTLAMLKVLHLCILQPKQLRDLISRRLAFAFEAKTRLVFRSLPRTLRLRPRFCYVLLECFLQLAFRCERFQVSKRTTNHVIVKLPDCYRMGGAWSWANIYIYIYITILCIIYIYIWADSFWDYDFMTWIPPAIPTRWNPLRMPAVRLLVELGADLNAFWLQSRTRSLCLLVFWFVSRSRGSERPLQVRNGDGETPLILVCRRGHAEARFRDPGRFWMLAVSVVIARMNSAANCGFRKQDVGHFRYRHTSMHQLQCLNADIVHSFQRTSWRIMQRKHPSCLMRAVLSSGGQVLAGDESRCGGPKEVDSWGLEWFRIFRLGWNTLKTNTFDQTTLCPGRHEVGRYSSAGLAKGTSEDQNQKWHQWRLADYKCFDQHWAENIFFPDVFPLADRTAPGLSGGVEVQGMHSEAIDIYELKDKLCFLGLTSFEENSFEKKQLPEETVHALCSAGAPLRPGTPSRARTSPATWDFTGVWFRCNEYYGWWLLMAGFGLS